MKDRVFIPSISEHWYIRQPVYLLLSGVFAFIIAVTMFQSIFITTERKNIDMEISVCERKNSASWGHDVRIFSIQVDGQQLDLGKIADEISGWNLSGKLLVSNDYQNTDPIILHLKEVQTVSIHFYGQEGSGIVRIRTNQRVKEIDLYNSDAEWKTIEWDDSGKKMFEIKSADYAGILIGWTIVFVLLLNSIDGKEHLKKIFECVLIVCCLCTLGGLVKECGITWETNDDATIAYLLSRPNNDFCPFIGHMLSAGLQRAYQVKFNLDWWLIVQLIGIMFGTFEILYVLCKRAHPVVDLAIAVCVCGLVWHIALEEPNFTRTSILVSTGGAIFVADAVLLRKKSDIKKVIEYVIGCLSLLAGQQIRSSGVWVALAGLAAIGIAIFLTDIRSFVWEEIRGWIFKGLFLWLAVGVVLCGGGIDQMLVTPEQVEYNVYNEKRSRIEDYALRYTDYQETEDNLSKENLETFLQWYSEDPSVFTDEKLDSTIQSGHPISSRYFFKNLGTLVVRNCFLIGIVMLCMVLQLVQGHNSQAKCWLALLTPFLIGTILSVYLVYVGRLPQRVFQPICFMTFVSYVMLLEKDEGAEKINVHSKDKKIKICSVFLTAAFLIYAYVSLPDVQRLQGHRCADRNARASDKKVFDAIALDYENAYFIPIQMDIHAPAEMFDIWDTVPEYYCDNVFFLGGWTAKMPYKLRLLRERGISNPTRALLEDDHAYTICREEITDFLRRNYDEHVSISGVKEVSDIMFVWYTMPIPDEKLEGKHTLTTNLQIHEELNDGSIGWLVTGIAEQAVNETLYCNVTLTDARYTYRIRTDENGNFSAFFYNIPDGSDPSYANAEFYIK